MQDPHGRTLLQQRQALRDAAFYECHGGFAKPVGERTASLWGRINFKWVAPLINQGNRGLLEEPTALAFLPARDDAILLSAQFWTMYNTLKVGGMVMHAACVGYKVQRVCWSGGAWCLLTIHIQC